MYLTYRAFNKNTHRLLLNVYIQLKTVLTGGGGEDCVLQLPFCDSCMQERRIVRFLNFTHGSRFTVLSLGHLDVWSCSVPKLWVVSVLAPTLSLKVPMFYLTEMLSSLSKREVSYCDQRECVHKSFCASPGSSTSHLLGEKQTQEFMAT